jgi:hypothetical protein
LQASRSRSCCCSLASDRCSEYSKSDGPEPLPDPRSAPSRSERLVSPTTAITMLDRPGGTTRTAAALTGLRMVPPNRAMSPVARARLA